MCYFMVKRVNYNTFARYIRFPPLAVCLSVYLFHCFCLPACYSSSLSRTFITAPGEIISTHYRFD